jgi:Flp pilus assembly pilin Flp
MWRNDDGQDLVEYALLVAFLIFVVAGVASIGGQSVKGIVNTSETQLSAANEFAGS